MFEKGEGKGEFPFTELLIYLKNAGIDVNKDNHNLIKQQVNKFFPVEGKTIKLIPKKNKPKPAQQTEPELDIEDEESSDEFIEMLAKQQLEKDK